MIFDDRIEPEKKVTFLTPSQVIEKFPWLKQYRIDAPVLGYFCSLEYVRHRVDRKKRSRLIDLESLLDFLIRTHSHIKGHEAMVKRLRIARETLLELSNK